MILVYCLLVIGVCFLCVAGYLWVRHWHVGTGISLLYRARDQKVLVESRLLKSPAGKSGVGNGDEVVSVDGHVMNFQNKEEFISWLKKSRPVVGKKITYHLRSNDGSEKVVEIIPRWVFSKIPIYPQFEAEHLTRLRESGDYEIELQYCRKIGRHHLTIRPSVRLLRRIFPS